jgi:hypothetical protein
MKNTIIGVGVGILGGILLSYAFLAKAEPIYYSVVEEPKEVLIEVRIDWTEERIKKEIRDTFPELTEVMLEVARCESGYENVPSPTGDFGIFQINQVHLSTLYDLGLNRENIQDNIRFARLLYEENGLKDWNNSRHCWVHSIE